MKHTKLIIPLLILFLAISCKNYYNEMLDWIDTIEIGLNIEDVKNMQPDYLEIDWEDPQNFENEKWYLITKIKGNNDVLGMSNFLVFIDDKYQGREVRK
ncbi:hypothetical protein [Kordia sp.]|uniref:hypothetical protein n=1 Tax=Kordia sp. TaxID=1965332 RepID=UPI003D2AEA98